MVKEIEELRLKESAAVEEQKKLSRSVRYQIMMTLILMMVTMTMMVIGDGPYPFALHFCAGKTGGGNGWLPT